MEAHQRHEEIIDNKFINREGGKQLFYASLENCINLFTLKCCLTLPCVVWHLEWGKYTIEQTRTHNKAIELVI
jgi:hypothetical protein